jgi:DNA modification methylase
MIELIHGDCIEELPKLVEKGIKVDLIYTDAPYLHVKGGNKNPKLGGKMKPDSFMQRKLVDFTEDKVVEFLDLSKELCHKDRYQGLYFCSKLQIPFYINWAIKNKLQFDLLIWDRDTGNRMTSTKFFASNIDYIVRIYKGGLYNIGDVEDKSSYYQKIHKFKQGDVTTHQTEKPVELLKKFILVTTNEGDTVLDMFSGTGSTGVACVETNRQYIGIELDEEYHKIAKERIENIKEKNKTEQIEMEF